MHHHEGHHLEITDMQRLVRHNLVQTDSRHTGITVLCEAIRQHLQHRLTGGGVGIDVDLTKSAIGSDIIHTSHVVIVGVGNQNGVYLTERLWQDLLTEVRSAVYQQTGIACLHQR